MSGARFNIAVSTQWLLVLIFLLYPFFTKFPLAILTYDAFGYYLYLPQAFIYGDLQLNDLTQLKQLVSEYQLTPTLYQIHPAETGNYVIQYSMGQSLMNLPFFALGHCSALLFGYPGDGFSAPYTWFILAGSYFYMVVGLIYLRKCLSHFYDPITSSIAMLLICLGTNYCFIHTQSQGMPHVYLFALYCFLVWRTIRWHDKPTMKGALILGATLGLMVLSRPTEVVAVLIPLLYGVYGKGALRERFRFLWTKKKHILIAIATGFLFILPQLIYWKFTAGEFIYNSYRNAGEGLELLHPHLIDFLTSFRAGWLLYTPLVLVALCGFFLMRDGVKQKWFLVGLAFVFVNVYISSSWSNWTYAGSFSQRTMVQSYVVLAIPLAGFVNHLRQNRKKWLLILPVLFILLNIFQSWQVIRGVLIPSRMTAAAYVAVFGRTTFPPDALDLLLIDRNDPVFEPQRYTLQKTHRLGDPEIEYTQNEPFGKDFRITYAELATKDHAWITTSVEILVPPESNPDQIFLVNTFVHDEKSYAWESPSVSAAVPDANNWRKMTNEYLTPEARLPSDELRIYLWNCSKGVVYRNFTISVYSPK